MNEESLFAAVLQKPTRAERQAFLDEACAGDAALRQRLEGLLAADERSGGLLDQDSDSEPGERREPDDLSTDGPGTIIGPYKLREQIGEGGFGLVYVAEQQEPVRRKVALKIIKPGVATREVIARFEAERQALALMDHPNIARVLDAGSVGTRSVERGTRSEEKDLSSALSSALRAPRSDGRPYFVMELVRGIAITEYADQNQSTTGERLELFISVCQAVQHAHQKGIIHRDIKPSNVLVARHDNKPVVKVIDFGVAKALNQQLTEHSVYTRFAQMIGTPLYMSPEQAELSGLDIDTRTDIYSLGVLLYELLTGTTPFDQERLKSVGFDELRRIIREEEPPKPSTRISTLGQAATTVSANRKSDPKRLSRSVRGELDWIVMKALEKDRNRRYETAADMARDIHRYLLHEPVEASPPSAAYRLRKFLRRNRGVVVAGSLVTLVLLGGVIGTTWGMIDARRAWKAESERAEAEAGERRRAESAEAEARKNEKAAKLTGDVARGIVRFIGKDLLAQAGSESQIARQFEPNPNLTVREALDRAAASVGERFKRQPEIEASIRTTIGDAYRQLGLYEKAIPHLRRAAELWAVHHGPEAEDTLNTLNQLGMAYREGGRTADARTVFEHLRDIRTKTLGPNDPATLKALNNLGATYLDANELTEAIALLERVRDARIKELGPEDSSTLGTANNLATAYWKAKRLDKSIPLFEEQLAVYRKVLTETHPDTIRSMANLGVNYRDAGRLDEAIPKLKQAYDLSRPHPPLRWIGPELLIAYARTGKSAEALPLVKEILASARKDFPAGSVQLADVLSQCGWSLLELKAWAVAEPILSECVAIREKRQPDDWRTFNTKSRLGQALLGQQKHEAAEPQLLQGYEGMKLRGAKIAAHNKVRLTEAIDRLIQLYEAWDKPDEAAKWRKELDSVGSSLEKQRDWP